MARPTRKSSVEYKWELYITKSLVKEQQSNPGTKFLHLVPTPTTTIEMEIAKRASVWYAHSHKKTFNKQYSTWQKLYNM